MRVQILTYNVGDVIKTVEDGVSNCTRIIENSDNTYLITIESEEDHQQFKVYEPILVVYPLNTKCKSYKNRMTELIKDKLKPQTHRR